MKNFIYNLVHFGKFIRTQKMWIRRAYFYSLFWLKFPVFFKRWVNKSRLNSNFDWEIPQDKGYLISQPPAALTQGALKELKDAFAKAEKAGLLNFKGKKNYITPISIEHLLTPKSQIYKLITSNDVLKPVTNYLGVVPIIQAVQLWYSPADRDDQTASSQHFHLDHEDYKQIKMYLYVDDVSEESGPLSIIDSTSSKDLVRNLDYTTHSNEKVLSDDIVRKYHSQAKTVRLSGPSGTLAFVDTSQCFHLGGRPGGKHRLKLMVQYLTPMSYLFPIINYKKKTELNPSLPYLEKMLFENSSAPIFL